MSAPPEMLVPAVAMRLALFSSNTPRLAILRMAKIMGGKDVDDRALTLAGTGSPVQQLYKRVTRKAKGTVNQTRILVPNFNSFLSQPIYFPSHQDIHSKKS